MLQHPAGRREVKLEKFISVIIQTDEGAYKVQLLLIGFIAIEILSQQLEINGQPTRELSLQEGTQNKLMHA